jgi:hypothetical protein
VSSRVRDLHKDLGDKLLGIDRLTLGPVGSGPPLRAHTTRFEPEGKRSQDRLTGDRIIYRTNTSNSLLFPEWTRTRVRLCMEA